VIPCRWSKLLSERDQLAAQVAQLERQLARADADSTAAARRAEDSLRATRLELSSLAAGRGMGSQSDPRRAAAELLVAQLHAADRAVRLHSVFPGLPALHWLSRLLCPPSQVIEADEGRRTSERHLARLELQLASLRESAGLTAWGDGVAAQREHMAALRDELMDLRTMLGPAAHHRGREGMESALADGQPVSVQQLKRLCQDYSEQLAKQSEAVASLRKRHTMLKQGVLQTQEGRAIDHCAWLNFCARLSRLRLPDRWCVRGCHARYTDRCRTGGADRKAAEHERHGIGCPAGNGSGGCRSERSCADGSGR
jgi:hypothetical protein